jgi:Peptidase M15/Bacterial SH3 domain
MLKSVIAAACLCAAGVAVAQSTLSGQQISDLVAGATVELDTPVGTKLPVRYAHDGKLSGEARDLASYLGAAFDRGRWWVSSDRLCHKWNRWFNSEPQCLRLSREGRLIRWRTEDGTSGTARISVPATILAGAVPPPAQPEPAKQIAPPKMPPAPAGSPETQPAETATSTPEPSPPPARETAAQPPPAKAPPAPVPATPEGDPPPKHQAVPKHAVRPMFKVVNVRGDDVLNVRSGPSADFDVVGALSPGSGGIAITSACRSRWCPVQHRSTNGWVNSAYLAPETPASPLSLQDSPDAPRPCLTAAARALLDRIEQKFGTVQVISTCRSGAVIAGTLHPSRHASGNAVDFLPGGRKAAIVAWLIANHHGGGTMTYADMDHIHVDIGPHFVSIANGPRWLSWRDSSADFPGSNPAGGRR